MCKHDVIETARCDVAERYEFEGLLCYVDKIKEYGKKYIDNGSKVVACKYLKSLTQKRMNLFHADMLNYL